MKTAVSIADDVFEEAERLSRRLNRSRSRLYTDAMREYLARHSPESVTEAWNAVLDDIGTAVDPAISAAAERVLRTVEW